MMQEKVPFLLYYDTPVLGNYINCANVHIVPYQAGIFCHVRSNDTFQLLASWLFGLHLALLVLFDILWTGTHLPYQSRHVYCQAIIIVKKQGYKIAINIILKHTSKNNS